MNWKLALLGSAFAVAAFVMPASAADNHYACYQVKSHAPQVNGVNVVTQISSTVANKCKLKFLCTPADKNGSGVANPALHYLCWQCKADKPAIGYNVTDQFFSGPITTKKLKFVCNPATKS